MTVLGRAVRGLATGAALWAASACVAVTINVQFPQEKLEGAAASIEDLVRGDKGATPAPPPVKREEKQDGKQGSIRVSGRWLAFLGPRAAEAQVPELKIRTPEVMASIQSRRQRFSQVQQWKQRGCIGENARGLVEARPGQRCAPEVAGLVSAENRDRMTLYRALVEQNRMPPEDLSRVQAAFAKVNRERAKAGEWVESEEGQWTRK